MNFAAPDLTNTGDRVVLLGREGKVGIGNEEERVFGVRSNKQLVEERKVMNERV